MDPRTWQFDAVDAWLDSIGLPDLTTTFRENDISGDLLLELDNATLIDMGVKSAGKRMKLIRCISELRL